MMRFLYLLSLTLLTISCNEEEIEKHQLRIENIKIDGVVVNEYFYLLAKKVPDTLNVRKKEFDFTFFINSYKGKMDFTVSDTSGIRLQGQFAESKGLLGHYESSYDLIDEIESIELINYYVPLRSGHWVYYKNNVVEKKEKYVNGCMDW